MRRMASLLAVGIFVAVLACMTARADDVKEGKVALDKVPKAVLDAVKAKFKDAELVSAQTEKEEGKLVYEIVLKHKGQTIDASFSPDGKLLSYERIIEAKDLPKEVSAALREKYGDCTIKRVEEATEGDKTSYEVLLATADKKQFEVIFDPSGKVLKEGKKEEIKEKKEEKKDKD